MLCLGKSPRSPPIPLISSQRTANAFAGAPLQLLAIAAFLADGVDIVVPDGVFDNTDVSGESAVDAMVTAWAANPYSFADTSNLTASFDDERNAGEPVYQEPLSMGASVLGLSFAADGDEVGIHDLDEPFVMSLAPSMVLNDSTLIAYCSHWNTSQRNGLLTHDLAWEYHGDGGIVAVRPCRFFGVRWAAAAFNKPCFRALINSGQIQPDF